jgi:hypothetical protein
MPKVVDLIRQGRTEECWQMCCGYLKMNLEQFMDVQNRLMMGQIESLSKSPIGRKFMGKVKPDSVDEYRQMVPLTDYSSYLPELSERMEELLPEKPVQWVHTSGKTGEYSCKWVPITNSFNQYFGPALCGLGLIAASNRWADTTPMIEYPNMMYTVAPRPYVSGAMASILMEQTPSRYYPSLSKAENLSFEERIKLGFDEALGGGIDFFFGLSLVLAKVGENFEQSNGKTSVTPYLGRPRAMARLARGLLRSKLEKRSLLPKDLWNVKGIITSGLDSAVYRDKIKHYWGKYPLDIYSCTEGGVIATQTWDYEGMTFIPNLNFLEFIPEKEHMKWQSNHSYQPKTVLLDEVKPGECYEIVISSFHNGALMRYRIGDMVRITSLRNDNLGIDIPQMVFERRADDLLDFNVIRLTEKSIWQAVENTGVSYNDWVAYKTPGELELNILIETVGNEISEESLASMIQREIVSGDNDKFINSQSHQVLLDMVPIKTKVKILPAGSFAAYSSRKRAEGSDLAHLKPPHINPSGEVLSLLTAGAGISDRIPDTSRESIHV